MVHAVSCRAKLDHVSAVGSALAVVRTMHVSVVLVCGRRALVRGYGYVGKDGGACVFSAECDPICALLMLVFRH